MLPSKYIGASVKNMNWTEPTNGMSTSQMGSLRMPTIRFCGMS